MTQTARNFGGALYELAREEALSDQILQELENLHQAFAAEPDYLRLLSTPAIGKQERCQIVDNSFRGKLQPYVLNFLKLLTEKGHIREFGDCCTAYRERYNEEHGIVPVQAVTCKPMTPEQKRRLTEKLSQVTGKTVYLSCKTDEACLGGVRLDFDGKRLDGTIRHRLEDIRRLLKNTVL